jgi:hypothetical protein
MALGLMMGTVYLLRRGDAMKRRAPSITRDTPQLSEDDKRRAAEISIGLRGDNLRLAQEWCDLCGVSWNDITGRGRSYRDGPALQARQGLAWILHHRGGMTLTAIAQALRRDHTTILHSIRQEQKRRDQRRNGPDE